MKQLFFVLIFFLSFKALGQSTGWEWQNPKPNGNPLACVHQIDSLRAVVVGGAGTIMRTTDGGQNWTSIPSGTDNDLNRIHFVNNQTAWIMGGKGTLLKTSDGGQSWQSQNPGIDGDLLVGYFLNEQEGWLATDSSRLRKTTDGGQTWQNLSIPVVPNSSNKADVVYFHNSQIGCIVVDTKEYSTTNGGTTWIDNSGNGFRITSFYFYTPSKGYAVAGGSFRPRRFYKTTNLGDTWQFQEIQNNNISELNRVQFFDSLRGFVYGLRSNSIDHLILRTTNGGATWQDLTPSNNPLLNDISWVHFADLRNGMAVHRNSNIIKTSNGGQTWHKVERGNNNGLSALHFLDSQRGWAAGWNGTLLKTVNGGTTWDSVSTGTRKGIADVHFFNTLEGLVIGQDGMIRKTTNGGVSWQNVSSGTTSLLKSLVFTDPLNAFIAGDGGTLLKTTNAGQSWQSLQSGRTSNLKALHFINTDTGWAVGVWPTTILKTTNGGLTWVDQNTGGGIASISLNSVFFTSAQKGWAVGIGGPGNPGMIKTTNGGESWETVTLESLVGFSSVHFHDSLHGYLCGNSGEMYTTKNGGLNWHKQYRVTHNAINAIWATDSLRCWMAGQNGSILFTAQGGDIITQRSLVSTPAFSLYPNPAREALVIRSDQPILHLSVVDALGKTLLYQKETKDRSAITLEVRDFKPGLFWVKVQTRSGVKIQRLVKN